MPLAPFNRRLTRSILFKVLVCMIAFASGGCSGGGGGGEEASSTFAIEGCQDFSIAGCNDPTMTFSGIQNNALGYMTGFYWGACDTCGRASVLYDLDGCIESIDSLPMRFPDCAFIDCSYTDCTIDGPLNDPVDDLAVTEGLLAHHHFEGELSNASDQLINCACFTEGVRGAAVSVHGEIDAVAVAAHRPPTLSVAAWVYLEPQVTSNCCPRIYGDMNWPEKKGFNLYFQADGDGAFDRFFAFSFFDADGEEHMVTSTANRQYSQWHHVAATYDGSTLRFYYNGNLTDELVVSEEMVHQTIGSTAYIGGERVMENGFTGMIDDVVLYDRALLAAEVQSLYDQVP